MRKYGEEQWYEDEQMPETTVRPSRYFSVLQKKLSVFLKGSHANVRYEWLPFTKLVTVARLNDKLLDQFRCKSFGCPVRTHASSCSPYKNVQRAPRCERTPQRLCGGAVRTMSRFLVNTMQSSERAEAQQ